MVCGSRFFDDGVWFFDEFVIHREGERRDRTIAGKDFGGVFVGCCFWDMGVFVHHGNDARLSWRISEEYE